MVYVLGLVATVLSVIGYLVISNVKASEESKIIGFYIRLFSAVMFIIYTVINKDYNVLILTLFYAVIDFCNLYNLLLEHKSR